MERTIGGVVTVVLAVAGCSLNTTGVGSDTQPELAQDGSGTGVTSGIGTSTDTAPATSEATIGAAGDTSESGPPAETGSPVPVLVISDDEIFEFGGQDIGTTGEHTFMVTNEGSSVATDLAVGGLDEPFTVQGSDCGPVLAPGASCQVVVHFAPELFGEYEGQLEVTFGGAGEVDSVARPFTGLGIGTTSNLIRNGGGEQGSVNDHPPVGWESFSGTNWAINPALAYMGSYSIHAGSQSGPDGFVLFQSVDAVELTNWGNAEGVRFYFRAYQRGYEPNNDGAEVRLRFSDSRGEELELHSTGIYADEAWLESTDDHEAPPNTHDAQLILVCHHYVGPECSAYFDEIEVWAEWLG